MNSDSSVTEPPSTGRLAPASSAEFEELLIAHQRPLLLFIMSLLKNVHESEDLLQKTNLVLWRKRAGFRAGSNFRAWSFAVARLEVFTRLRQQRRDQRILSEQQNHEATTGHFESDEADRANALIALKNCLQKLPSRDRELLSMRYGSGRPLSEYARDLNRSPGTLKARLFKIRETLRRSIQEQLRESDPPFPAR